MLLQTNSYVVPKEKRAEHARLVARFRRALARIGCDGFDVYEQVGSNWTGDSTGRFVQILRFRDREHQLDVQAAERADPDAQALVRAFCELINFPYQEHQGFFTVGFFVSILANAATAPAGTGVVPAGAAHEPEADATPSPIPAMAATAAAASGSGYLSPPDDATEPEDAAGGGDADGAEDGADAEGADHVNSAAAEADSPADDGSAPAAENRYVHVWDEVTSSDEPSQASDVAERTWEATAELAAGARSSVPEPDDSSAPAELRSPSAAPVADTIKMFELDGVAFGAATNAAAATANGLGADDKGGEQDVSDANAEDEVVEETESEGDEDEVEDEDEDEDEEDGHVDGRPDEPTTNGLDDAGEGGGGDEEHDSIDDDSSLTAECDDGEEEGETEEEVVETTAPASAVFSDAVVTVADAEAEEPGEVELDETAFELLGPDDDILGTDDE